MGKVQSFMHLLSHLRIRKWGRPGSKIQLMSLEDGHLGITKCATGTI